MITNLYIITYLNFFVKFIKTPKSLKQKVIVWYKDKYFSKNLKFFSIFILHSVVSLTH